jgi:SET domain-containing protein
MTRPIDGLLEFRPSSIHGMGAFAGSDLPAGVPLVEYLGERIDKAESQARCERGESFIFHLDDLWDLDGNVAQNSARWLNHSCAPNCDAECIDGRIWILSNRPIARGEELTFNYGYDLENYREHPCCCGDRNCVGFIVDPAFFPILREKQL